MQWTVMLGPDNQAAPMDKWNEYRDRGLLSGWDVYCRKVKNPNFPHYTVWLTRGKEMLSVGETINYRGWNAFGPHGFRNVNGFKTRRYAIDYMLEVRGFVRPL